MSKKHNYTNYSKTQEAPAAPEVKPEIEETAVTETPVAPQVDPETPANTEDDDVIIGVVTECAKLNVRKEPSLDTDIVAVIPLGAEVQVDIFESTEDFYKVCTSAGVEGFCIKERIAIN